MAALSISAWIPRSYAGRSTRRRSKAAKLTAKRRKKLPKTAFAIPEKRAYPINDRRHAANALSRVAQHGTPAQKRRVRAAVARRYPSLPSSKKRATAKKRRRGVRRKR